MMNTIFRTCICTAMVLGALSPASARAQVSASDVLQGYELTQKEINRLESGEVLAYSDEEYEFTARELSSDAMVLVHTNLNAIVRSLEESPSVIPTNLVKDSAVITSEEDFAGVAFLESEYSEVQELFAAKPGDDWNLSEAEFAMIQQRLAPHLDSDQATQISVASDVMRDILIGRYNRYLANGLQGIEGYKRSKRKTVDVGAELQLSTDSFLPFEDEFPEFVKVVTSFPEGAECCEHMFRWIKVRIRKRYAFALSHIMIQKTEDFVLFTERQYFVSTLINSLQVTLAWLPYEEGEGEYLGLAMSASADVLDSTIGRMLRGIGRNKAKDLVTDVMKETRDELETLVE